MILGTLGVSLEENMLADKKAHTGDTVIPTEKRTIRAGQDF